jgi:single-strand DNA-binding protein
MGSGEPVCNFSLATSETWRDKATGERKERTEWHNIVIFNENLSKVAEQYVKKGSKVYIEGSLQTRKFTDKNGAERTSTEVVLQRFRGEMTLLDGRSGAGSDGDEGGGSMGYSGGSSSGSRPAMTAPGGGRSDLDDDIPF